MSKIEYLPYPQDIRNALFKTLLKRVPPKSYSPHLEDIINVLMNALLQGELEVDIDKAINESELKNKGWPQIHIEALIKSGWLTGENPPIKLEGSHLSWRRWHNEMNEVIQDIIHRSKLKKQVSINLKKPEETQPLKTLNYEQQTAVDVIESQTIILLSGGPGTGKTSTILQMLLRALSITSNLNIGLAAPTGKATRRLQESLQQGLEKFEVNTHDNLKVVPCKTLHKWLQAQSQGFAKSKRNPLDLDLLVIDEMSMVDLTLMKALLEALPKECQLVLVGDPNQLAPVNSGAVWHHLQKEKVRLVFEKGAIHLHKHYRSRGEIASLSRLLCEQGTEVFWQKASSLPISANVQTHHYKSRSIPPVLIRRIKEHSQHLKSLSQKIFHKMSKASEASSLEGLGLKNEGAQLLCCVEELMVLCPKRYGMWGVDEIHKALFGINFAEDISYWPQGTPVMCGENQEELLIANGDIGIVIGEGDERRLLFRLFTEERKLTTQIIHPARLKAIKPAFAMTIHKAQGSEANEVFVLWPEKVSKVSPVNNQNNDQKSYENRLLYTAITRAKKKVDLIINTDS